MSQRRFPGVKYLATRMTTNPRTTHQSRPIKYLQRTHLCAETEYRQNRGSRHIQFNAVLGIHLLAKREINAGGSYPDLFKLEVPQFVDGECLKRSVEERNGVKPLQNRRHRLPVDQQARKEEATDYIGIKTATIDEQETHLNNMTNVPTKLARLVLSNAMDNSSITLAVVKLNNTNVSMNFQNAGTVATSPTRPYTIPPNKSGGTKRNGRISKRTFSGRLIRRKTPREWTCLGREIGKGRIVTICSVAISIEAYGVTSHIPLAHEQNSFVRKQTQA